jgi:hypothetical protein
MLSCPQLLTSRCGRCFAWKFGSSEDCLALLVRRNPAIKQGEELVSQNCFDPLESVTTVPTISLLKSVK